MPQLALSQVSIIYIFSLFLLRIARAPAALADIEPFDGKPDLLADLAEAWGWAVCYQRFLQNFF